MPIDWKRNRLLFQRLSALLGKLSRRPEPDSVHHFRTTARRLEAVFEALEPTPIRSHRKLLKQIGRVRRRCGQLRDVDVQIAALRSLRVDDPEHKQRLLRRLERLRSKRQEKLATALDPGDLRKLRVRLRKAAGELGAPSPANGFARAEPLYDALRMFAALVRAHGPLTEESLHQYRIQGKRVRYRAEMAGDSERAREVVRQLKRMQDAIGEWHDWWDLNRVAEELFTDTPNCALVMAMHNATRVKFDAAIKSATEVKRFLLAQHRALAAERRRLQPAAAAAPARTTAATA